MIINMSRRHVYILAAGLVVIIVIAAVAFLSFGNPQSNTAPEQTQNGTGTNVVTREAPPSNVVVPDTGTTNVPTGVAVPESVSPSQTGSSQDLRTFAIQANAGAFIPDTVIMKKGDTVHINITAVDRDYDFTQPDYGANGIKIPKGTTKAIDFDGTAPGKFMFYCSSCGGPTKGPVGYIIITN